LEPKRLICLDEDHTIEITRPADQSVDLIITVSIARTYVFTDLPLPASQNGTQEKKHLGINAFVM